MLKTSALAFTVLLAGTAFGQRTAMAKRELRTVYDSVSFNYNHENIDGAMAWLDPDFKWTLLDGKVLNRDASRAAMKDFFDTTQSGHWHIDMLNTMVAGPLATVIAQYRFDGLLIDPSKKTYKATLVSTDRQTWFRGPNGWRQISDALLTQKTYAGGLKTDANVNSDQSGSGPGVVTTPPLKTGGS